MSSWIKLVVAALVLTPQLVWGWGHTGHRVVAQAGTKLAKNGSVFWGANLSNMAYLTNIPDMKWKSLPTANIEKPTHFFQPDSYYDSASQFELFPRSWAQAVQKFGESSLDKNGTAPWRVGEFYRLAVAAFKKGDFTTGIQLAGAMSHYVGDLSQPLHVTKNYDGGETDDIGIHKFFETTNIAPSQEAPLVSEVTDRAAKILADPQFLATFNKTKVDAVFEEAERAYSFRDQLINIDLKEGRSGQGAADMLELAKSRMADGAATLAVILSQMWQEAGLNQSSGASVGPSVAAPDWVKPDYTGLDDQSESPVAYDDDCQ